MKSLSERIEKNLTTKKGSIAAMYNDAMYLIENPNKTLRPVSWSRSKGHMNLRDVSANCINGLNLVGIDFETGNDAPRGGKEGFFIRLTEKGKKQVASYNRKRLQLIEDAKIQAAKEAEERKAKLTAEIEAMPENTQFEYKWNSCELKNASGLSWSAYRGSLKNEFPAEWQILKAKFKIQQSI